jgi:hypothetical protein
MPHQQIGIIGMLLPMGVSDAHHLVLAITSIDFRIPQNENMKRIDTHQRIPYQPQRQEILFALFIKIQLKIM